MNFGDRGRGVAKRETLTLDHEDQKRKKMM